MFYNVRTKTQENLKSFAPGGDDISNQR